MRESGQREKRVVIERVRERESGTRKRESGQREKERALSS